MLTMQPIDLNGKLDLRQATYLMLSMTRRCNMRCPGCYYLQQDENFFQTYDIRLDDAREIINYYRHSGVTQAIANAEGDVLLHPQYADLIEHINSAGFQRRPWLITNGIELPRHADFIVNNIEEILISVDGPDHQRYNAFRGGNESLFNKVITGIRAVVDARRRHNSKSQVFINYVVTRARCKDIPEMIRLAEALKVDYLKIANFHVAGDAVDQEHQPVRAAVPETDATLRRILQRSDYRTHIMLPTLQRHIDPPYSCRMLASVMVGSNGDYAPCCRIAPESKWGNYYRSEHRHNNDALRRFRLSVITARAHSELPAICQQCFHLSPSRAVFDANRKFWTLSSIS